MCSSSRPAWLSSSTLKSTPPTFISIEMDDETLTTELLKVRGLGPWSVHMFGTSLGGCWCWMRQRSGLCTNREQRRLPARALSTKSAPLLLCQPCSTSGTRTSCRWEIWECARACSTSTASRSDAGGETAGAHGKWVFRGGVTVSRMRPRQPLLTCQPLPLLARRSCRRRREWSR